MAVTYLYIFGVFKFQILFSTIGMAHYVELILFPYTLTSLIVLLSFPWKACTYLWLWQAENFLCV